jgi:hypothetical protein
MAFFTVVALPSFRRFWDTMNHSTRRLCVQSNIQRRTYTERLHPCFLRINPSRINLMSQVEEAQEIDQTPSVEEREIPEAELECFSRLTNRQQRYVRLWVKGDKGQAECYAEAYGHDLKEKKQSVRASAHKTHHQPKVQAAIRVLTGRMNTDALLSRKEKRGFLASVVRAHTPDQLAIDPKSPYLAHSPMVAIQRDNELAGHLAPTEVHGELTLGAILTDLKSSPLIDPRTSIP